MTSISTQPAEPWTIDADRWPDVAAVAGPAARAAVARALFTTAVARLPLRVKLPDGRLQRGQVQRHQVLGAGGRPPRSWSCTGPGTSSAASAPPA